MKTLFLDRDGIINIDEGYTYKIENFRFMPHIFELIKLFTTQNYQVIIVTNQSGIGRGYYSLADFQKLTAWMIKEFNAQGITIAKVLYCPHSPDESCECRKPNIGMIKEAMRLFPIDLAHSYMIGDKQSDIDLALNASIGSTIAIDKSGQIQKASLNFATITEAFSYLESHKGRL